MTSIFSKIVAKTSFSRNYTLQPHTSRNWEYDQMKLNKRAISEDTIPYPNPAILDE